MSDTFREGQVLAGRYRLVRILGRGGMGAVWMAVHTATGRRVAVKVILPEKVTRAGALERFQREAQALGKIESPFVTQVIDAGTDDSGAAYLVMEMFDGEDVSKLIDRLGPLPPPLAARIAHQALLGLHAAHAAGTIHRDVKPANLFLSKQGEGERAVKVLDFGIAKLVEDESPGDTPASRQKLTATGMVFGSVPYMSPEQVAGSKQIDHRTDVWSLGVSLYEMLTGQLPFVGVDLVLVIMQIAKGDPVPLLSRAPWVPVELAAVVARAMARDPAARYPTAAAMARDLEPFLRGGRSILEGSLVALPEEIRMSAPAAPPAGGPAPEPPAPEPPPPVALVPVPPPDLAGSAASSPSTLASSGNARPAASGGPLLAVGGVLAVLLLAGSVYAVVRLREGTAPSGGSVPAPGPSSSTVVAPAEPPPAPVPPADPPSGSTATSPPLEEPPKTSSPGPSATAVTGTVTGPPKPGPASPKPADNPFGGTRKP